MTSRDLAAITRASVLAAGLAVILLSLGGCGPFIDPNNLQDRAEVPAPLSPPGSTVDQTFVAGCDGLAALDLQVALYPGRGPAEGQLNLSLWSVRPIAHRGPTGRARPSLGQRGLIASQSFAEATLRPNQWIRLSFPPIVASRGHAFRLRVRRSGPGPSLASVWTSGHVAPAHGQLDVDGRPARGALTFRAWCDQSPVQVGQETLGTVARGGAAWPLALLLCILPGLGMASLVDHRQDGRRGADSAAFLGLAVGWSVLLAPIALAVATPFRAGAWVGAALSGFGLLATAWRRPRLELSPWSACALAALPVAVVVRAIDAKGLVAPMWGDPVQHSYVAALILRDRGVPATYGSLVPPQVFDYHFGFQTIAASVSVLSGASVTDAVLATGQILDALIGLAVYRLARDLVGSARAAAVAAVLVALVTTQPTYFVTWGRYPELAGLVALPAAAAALRTALGPADGPGGLRSRASPAPVARALPPNGEPAALAGFLGRLGRPCLPRPESIVAAVAAAALVVVHPRVGIFLACLAPALLAAGIVDRRTVGRTTAAALWNLLVVAVVSLALLLPWTIRLWTVHQHQVLVGSAWRPLDFPWGLATAGNDRWVLALAGLALLVAVVRRPGLAVLLVGWSALVLVLANPATFHLPLNLYLDNGSLAIALFLPSAILVGYLFETVAGLGDAGGRYRVGCARAEGTATLFGFAERVPAIRGFAGGIDPGWLTALLVFLAGASQAPHLTGVVNPCCLLIRPGDLGAIAWVRNHTPPDARFLINGYVWQSSIWMGTDAGYWLPVLAQRQTSLPPLFYATGGGEELERVNAIAAAVHRAAADPTALAAVARQVGARYVFVGARGGAIDPFVLARSGLFRVDYEGGGAWVLELVDPAGALRSSTVTGMMPAASLPPRDSKAAGLRSSTSGYGKRPVSRTTSVTVRPVRGDVTRTILPSGKAFDAVVVASPGL